MIKFGLFRCDRLYVWTVINKVLWVNNSKFKLNFVRWPSSRKSDFFLELKTNKSSIKMCRFVRNLIVLFHLRHNLLPSRTFSLEVHGCLSRLLKNCRNKVSTFYYTYYYYCSGRTNSRFSLIKVVNFFDHSSLNISISENIVITRVTIDFIETMRLNFKHRFSWHSAF